MVKPGESALVHAGDIDQCATCTHDHGVGLEVGGSKAAYGYAVGIGHRDLDVVGLSVAGSGNGVFRSGSNNEKCHSSGFGE